MPCYAILAAVFSLLAASVNAASSKFCVDGSYTVLGHTGTKDRFRGNVAAPSGRFLVQGQYTQFWIDPVDFAIYEYAWTGKANVGDMTDGRLTTVFASKKPDHRGLTLTSTISLELRDEDLKISRIGAGGLSMSKFWQRLLAQTKHQILIKASYYCKGLRPRWCFPNGT